MNRNYIILNGVNSQTIEGLFIKDLPPITKPPMRNTKEEIDGRDGDIITKLGYGAYDKEITIGLANNYDIDEVIAFFTKESTPDIIPSFTHNEIVFSNEPDKIYYFSQLDQIDFNKLIKFRTATVSFHCQPFKYEYDENFISFVPQTTTGTGTTITLTPSSPTKLTLGLKGNTEQDISKNIFQTNGNITYGGITTTDNGDGTLTLSNSASVDIVALQSEKTQTIAAGTYTFSIQEALPFNIYFMFTLSGSMSSATINAGQTSTTFTTQAISKYRLWASGLTVGTTYSQTIKVQLEEGSSPTKWLPYGVPSPSSPTEVKTVTGDNTITITNADSSKSQSYPLNLGVENLFSGDNPVTVTRYKWVDFSLPVGKYTIMASEITKSTTDNLTCYVRFMINSSNQATALYLDPANPIATFTLNSAITGIYFYSSNNASSSTGITADFKDLMIVKGSYYNRLSYSAYGVTPIELCKIGNYQDYIYKSNGNWYIHKEIGKVVLDGSEDTWSTVQAYSKTFFVNTVSNILVSTSGDNDALLRCDNYNNYKSNDIVSNNGKDYGICRRNNQSQLLFRNKDIGTLNDFQTWLGTHNTKVYYPLATPIEEEITNTILIDQLDAIENANGYSGTTNITSTYFKEPIIIDASIIADNDFTVTNKGNYFSKPSLIIAGSGIIGIYLDGYQIFNIDMGSTESTYAISTKTMEAYKMIGLDGYEIANRQVTGDYSNFKLKSGNNTISFSGNISLILLAQYSRWL